MLDDAAFDVEKWLAHEIATEFARAEGAAFVKGTGANQPLGLPGLAQCGDGSTAPRPMGTLQYRRRPGVPARFPASNPAGQADRPRPGAALAVPAGRGVRDELGDRGGGSASSRPRTARSCGSRAWRRGSRRRLLGYPVVEAEDMPDIAANSAVDRVRQFQGRLSDRRAQRDARSCAIPTPTSRTSISTRPSGSAGR